MPAKTFSDRYASEGIRAWNLKRIRQAAGLPPEPEPRASPAAAAGGRAAGGSPSSSDGAATAAATALAPNPNETPTRSKASGVAVPAADNNNNDGDGGGGSDGNAEGAGLPPCRRAGRPTVLTAEEEEEIVRVLLEAHDCNMCMSRMQLGAMVFDLLLANPRQMRVLAMHVAGSVG